MSSIERFVANICNILSKNPSPLIIPIFLLNLSRAICSPASSTFPFTHLSYMTNIEKPYTIHYFLVYEDISAPSEDIAYEATKQLGILNHRLNLLRLEEEARQIKLPNITLSNLFNRIPCSCDKGICKCCAGKFKLL